MAPARANRASAISALGRSATTSTGEPSAGADQVVAQQRPEDEEQSHGHAEEIQDDVADSAGFAAKVFHATTRGQEACLESCRPDFARSRGPSRTVCAKRSAAARK